MIKIVLLMMIIFSICAIQTTVLRRAIIYLCIFSLLSSFCYLLFQAPDVAIAEAVIGCTLSTILFLVASKQYKVFRVYYCHLEELDSSDRLTEKNLIISTLKSFSLDKELELDLIDTTKTVKSIEENDAYDIIVEHCGKEINVYGTQHNYHYESLIKFFNNNFSKKISFHYILLEGDELL